MPYFEFPETPPMNKLQDYDLFRGYVHSKNLKWSYGAVKGREVANLFRAIDQMPLADQIKHIRALGFEGIYIDRRGYADKGVNLENGLSKILGNGPIVSENGNLSFFNLTRYSQEPIESVPVPLVVLGQGFYNWENSGSGKKWAWASGNGQLLIYNFRTVDEPCHLKFDLATLVNRHLDLSVNGEVIKYLELGPQKTEHVEIILPLRNGFNSLMIKSDVPARAPGNGDPRLLSFSIQQLILSCEQN
jgi:phosphoglycerol transferase